MCFKAGRDDKPDFIMSRQISLVHCWASLLARPSGGSIALPRSWVGLKTAPALGRAAVLVHRKVELRVAFSIGWGCMLSSDAGCVVGWAP